MSVEVSGGADGKRRTVEAVLGAVGVRMDDVRKVRASSSVEGEGFERPEEWKRLHHLEDK